MTGRPRAPTEVVNVGQIMTFHDIIAEDRWNLLTLIPEIATNKLCIQWLAKRRLIINTCLCNICHMPARLVAYSRGVDGYQWSCQGCSFGKSVRDGSFFTKSHLSLKQILIMIYCWSSDFPQSLIQHEAGINKSTVVDWCNFLREECEKYMARHFSQIGGMDILGQPIVVEIDESKYFHRKYHRGQWNEGHWVFGGIERISGKCFLVEVPDRSEATLTTEIVAHILPGSHIISDGWSAYANISRIANGIYTHCSVIHQENFVDQDDPEIHTQNIENMWMRAKRKLKRQFGTSRTLFPSFLHEFAFRNEIRHGNVLGTLITGIAESYPV